MLVTFPKEVVRPTVEQVEYLKGLDGKLGNFLSRLHSKTYNRYQVRHSTKEKLTIEEMSRILSFFDFDNGLALTPKSSRFGFSYSYNVFHTHPRPDISNVFGKKERLLTFDYNQIPSEMSEQEGFDRLSEIFMRPKNIKLLKNVGLGVPSDNIDRYQY